MVKPDILDLTISKVPMLKPSLAYVVGVLCARFFDFPFFSYLPYIFVLGFLILIFCYNRRRFSWAKKCFTFLFYFLFLVLGIWKTDRIHPDFDRSHFSHFKADHIIAIIDDEPVYKEKTIRFPAKVVATSDSMRSVKSSGKIMLTVLRDSSEDRIFKYGDCVVFKNTTKETNPPYNPKEFDYKQYLANKAIWHQCFLLKNQILITDHGFGNKLIQASLAIREKLIQKFDTYIENERAFQIAVALIFGYRSQIDAQTISAFTNTGTIHVLSVSGLHVSMVFAFLTFLFRWLDRLRYGRIIRFGIILIAIWLYVILTGMSPPILRAGIMISFFIVSIATKRKQVSVNTLLASAFFILFFAPNHLFDVGFQLSYCAMFGIFLLYPILRNFYLPMNKYARWVCDYTYISIAAQLFTMPLALYYFGQFPNYFLLANLFIAIPSTVIMCMGLFLAIIPVDFLSSLLGKALDYILIFSVDGLSYIEHLPFSTIQGIEWNIGLSVLSILCITFLILALNYRNKYALFGMLISFVCMNSVLNSIAYRKLTTSSYRIYNVRNEIAVAYIHGKNVILYSTFDSVNHPTLQFNVMNDLKRFSKIEAISFQRLNNVGRSNYSFDLGNKSFLILENKLDRKLAYYDFLIWRKNNSNALEDLVSVADIILIDGSNSDKTIEKLAHQITNNRQSIYLLKNNFAYVWDEEQK